MYKSTKLFSETYSTTFECRLLTFKFYCVILLTLYTLFTVSSIQSFPRDDKTPTAETFSPLAEKSNLPSMSIPIPKKSDFMEPEIDIYSELCTEQLDNLDKLMEENDNSLSNVQRPNNVNLQLQPLELKDNETKEQKLTTPGNKV